MGDELEVRLAVAEEKIKSLEQRVSGIEQTIVTKFDALNEKFDTLIKNWNNRPSWFVSLIIGALLSVVTGFAVHALG